MLNSQHIFMGSVVILVAFNFFFYLAFPGQSELLTFNILSGGLGLLITGGVLAGLHIAGVGLSSFSQRLVFGAGALLNILFQIPLGGTVAYLPGGIQGSINLPTGQDSWMNIGLGLAQTPINYFFAQGIGNPLVLVGFLLCTAIGIMAFVSGMIILIQGGAGD